MNIHFSHLVSSRLIIFFFTTLVLLSSFDCEATTRRSSLRTFGDIAQIANPVAASLIASQEKGAGHYAIILGETLIVSHGIKFIVKQNKWKMGKRPYIKNKHDRFEGMPSAHTSSAWSAAAYVRTFSEERKWLSIPLYLTAAVTGYSRVHSKEHTTAQVIAGAVLAEAITFITSKLKWSNEYNSTNFSFSKEGAMISFEFKF